MSNLLEVKNLEVSFHTYAGEVKAVRGVSFEAKAGECLAIVGESGSGKTVTSKAVLGLIATPPGEVKKTSEIIFDGQNIMNYSEKEWRAYRGKDAAYDLPGSHDLPEPDHESRQTDYGKHSSSQQGFQG